MDIITPQQIAERDDLVGMTTCSVCNQMIPQEFAIIGKIKIRMGVDAEEDHLCSAACLGAWYKSWEYYLQPKRTGL